MTNTSWAEADGSPDSSNVPQASDWLRFNMHLHSHYRPSEQVADTSSNINNNAQQEDHLDDIGLDFDFDVEGYLDMQNFDAANDTDSNIDPNLTTSGSNTMQSSSPHPAPQYFQPPRQVVADATPLGSNQNNYMTQIQYQGVASPSDHHSAPSYSQINIGIAPARFANTSRSDQIGILTARQCQYAHQSQPYCLPPSGQHGMRQPVFNINTSNVNFATQHNLHPDSNRGAQFMPHTIDSQGHITFLEDEVSTPGCFEKRIRTSGCD